MKKQLVSFKTAKLAKEKGFKEYCRRLYVLSEQKENDKIGKIHYRTETYFSNSNYTNEPFVSAPTQSLLQKWLREKHNVEIEINKLTKYFYKFYKGDLNDYNSDKLPYKTYEQALEKGLQEALKLI